MPRGAYGQHPGTARSLARRAQRDVVSDEFFRDESPIRVRHAPDEATHQRQRRDRSHDIDWQVSPDDRYDDEWPATVRFVEEDGSDYIVLDLLTGNERRVPKQRLALEMFPATRQYPLRGSTLLRLSGFALIGALLGGVVGIMLGSIVLVVALIRLAAFERRAHVWRSRQAQGVIQSRRRQRRIALPAAATSERLRLLTALGQSLLAIALAVAELSLATALLR